MGWANICAKRTKKFSQIDKKCPNLTLWEIPQRIFLINLLNHRPTRKFFVVVVGCLIMPNIDITAINNDQRL
jgi:hypothetical protein